MDLSLLDLAAVFLSLSACVGWLNLKLFNLPMGVVMLVVGIVAALSLSAFDRLAPGLGVHRVVGQIVAQVDFSNAVLKFMLAYLLFAGAMHVDLDELRRRGFTAATLATIGVAISAVVVGGGFWLCARAIGLSLSWPWALVFGVLISPTDPVGVLAVLKRTTMKPDIRALVEGEALFNDGVGVVLFGAAVALATGGGQASAGHMALGLLVQAGGGALLGLIGGMIAIRAMRSIDEYGVEIGITLALATGLYALSLALDISGPIAVVVAGLMVGQDGAKTAMSEQTRRYTRAFWTIVDDNLNGVLFLLLGLEIFTIPFDSKMGWLAAAAIPLIFIGRGAALAGPSALLTWFDRSLNPGLIAVLTWAGVRGGISVALALALPASPERSIILTATYAVVVFSVICQSLTLERLVVRLGYGHRMGDG